jgi:hypothetical protein
MVPSSRSAADRRRFAAIWADPLRKRATLELFARTEADGGRDLAAAAARTRDAWLREHLARHAADEERHARLFRERAAELSAEGVRAADVSERNLALAPERADHDAHGFMRDNLYDELGELAYVAMLHVAERRAADLFALHRDLLTDDARTREVFSSILHDEVYHVAYTGTALERWRRAGRAGEVRAALHAARGGRRLDGLRRVGARAGASLGRVLLLALQATLLLPAVPLARRALPAAGWKPGAALGDPRSEA